MTAPSASSLLVASESRITRRVVEMTFADQHVQVTAATTGEDALKAWHARPTSVVIADITMDAPNGYTIAHEVRAHQEGRRTAVILLASQNEVVDELAVNRSRVSAVLRKPLDSHQLIDAVREAVRSGPPPARLSASAAGDESATPPPVVAAPMLAPPPDPPSPFDEASPFEAPVPPVVDGVGADELTARPLEPPAEPHHRSTMVDDALAEAEDVALLLGRASADLDDPPVPVAVAAAAAAPLASGGELADTFHALLEVEQGGVPTLAAAASGPPLPAGDSGAVATRLAAQWPLEPDRLARLEREALAQTQAALTASAERAVPAMAREIVEQLARELVPSIVDEMARQMVSEAADRLVREEIARLRNTRPQE